MGSTWHKACFTCGVLGAEPGCKRTMNRENYQDHAGAPYCTACYGRLFKPKGFGYGNTLNTEEKVPAVAAVSPASPAATSSSSGVNVVVPSDVTFESHQKVRRSSGGSAGLAALINSGPKGSGMSPPPVPAAVAPAPASFKSSSTAPKIAENAEHHPKCPTCEKNVYKMEEIVAMSRTWHKSCFVCGTNRGDGCGKTLPRDGYLEHENAPYCLTCHGRLHGAQNLQNLTQSVAALSTKPGTAGAAPQRRDSKRTDIHPSELFAGDGDEVGEAEW